MVLAIFVLSPSRRSCAAGCCCCADIAPPGTACFSGRDCALWPCGFENAVLILDMYVIPNWDLKLVRLAIPLGGLAALLYGLLWEAS